MEHREFCERFLRVIDTAIADQAGRSTATGIAQHQTLKALRDAFTAEFDMRPPEADEAS